MGRASTVGYSPCRAGKDGEEDSLLDSADDVTTSHGGRVWARADRSSLCDGGGLDGEGGQGSRVTEAGRNGNAGDRKDEDGRGRGCGDMPEREGES